jgi:hypothetical protein
MFRKCISFAVFALGALAIVVVCVAQQGPTEAPTGFDTPTLAQDRSLCHLRHATDRGTPSFVISSCASLRLK